MKRLLACLLAAAMVLSLVVAPTHDHDHGHVHAVEETDETVPTIMVDTVVANPGEEVRVPLLLVNNNQKFAGMGLWLDVDPALDAMVYKVYDDPDTKDDESAGYDFNYDIVIETEADRGRAQYLEVMTPNPYANPVQLLLESLTNTKEPVNGEFQTLIFTLKEDAVPGRYEITIIVEEFTCFNEDFDDLHFELVSGAVIIPCQGEHDWEIETTATCTEAGVTTYTCKTCTITETEDTPALGHTEEVIPGHDATCTETGLTDGAKCSVCGETLTAQDEIPAKGHTAGDPVKENEVAPECTEDGSYDEVIYCSVCGVEISRQEKPVTAPGHTEEVIPGKAATCTETGLTDGKKCSVCGEILTAQEVIPALGHSFTNYVSDGNATCDQDGTETAKCDRCDATHTRTDVGSKEDAKHSFSEYTSDGNATCTADGTKSRVCTVCGEKETVIDAGSALGHTEEVIPGHDATCTESGLTNGVKCSVCGETLTKQEVIPAKGHTEEVIPGHDAT